MIERCGRDVPIGVGGIGKGRYPQINGDHKLSVKDVDGDSNNGGLIDVY